MVEKLIERIRKHVTGRGLAAAGVVLLLGALCTLLIIMLNTTDQDVWAVTPWIAVPLGMTLLAMLAIRAAPYVEAKTLVDHARQLITSGQYQVAVLVVNRAIHLRPRLIDAYITRSAAYAGLSKLELAMEDAERAVKIAPREPETRLARARLYTHRGRHDDAIRDLQFGISQKPDWAVGYLELAQLQIKLRDYQNGLATLRALDIHTTSERIRYDAWIYAGQVYEKNLLDLDMAIAAYTQAIPILPDCKIGYLHRAYAYRSRGDLYQAAEDLLRAAQRLPTPEDAGQYHWLRAVCYNRRWTITHDERDFAAWIGALQSSLKDDAPAFADQSRQWLETLLAQKDNSEHVADTNRQGRPPAPQFSIN